MRIGFGESFAGRVALSLSDLEEAAIESDFHGVSSLVHLQLNWNVCRTAETRLPFTQRRSIKDIAIQRH
jgi:hypothetical protein